MDAGTSRPRFHLEFTVQTETGRQTFSYHPRVATYSYPMKAEARGVLAAGFTIVPSGNSLLREYRNDVRGAVSLN